MMPFAYTRAKTGGDAVATLMANPQAQLLAYQNLEEGPGLRSSEGSGRRMTRSRLDAYGTLTLSGLRFYITAKDDAVTIGLKIQQGSGATFGIIKGGDSLSQTNLSCRLNNG